MRDFGVLVLGCAVAAALGSLIVVAMAIAGFLIAAGLRLEDLFR
jgi:hypothetical protein